jgi:hypothetical protein
MNSLGAKEWVGLNFFAESVNGWLRKLQQHEAPIFKDLAQRSREHVRNQKLAVPIRLVAGCNNEW